MGMDVILAIDNFPILSKQNINNGKIPPNALKIANFLRAIFLLSNSLLNDNNFVIFIPKRPSSKFGLLILFNGERLRYLAPDERGILFLLLKVCKILTGKGGKKKEIKESMKFRNMEKCQSTPGVFLKQGPVESLWDIYPQDGKKFIFFDAYPPESNDLHSWEELFTTITDNIVLVFPQNNNMVFLENDNIQLYAFRDQSWKAKFYESELISYLQSKILQ
jgi:hypothetical protein